MDEHDFTVVIFYCLLLKMHMVNISNYAKKKDGDSEAEEFWKTITTYNEDQNTANMWQL